MKAVSTSIALGLGPYHATRPIRRFRCASVRCGREEIWHKNLALQQKHQTQVERLRQDIDVRNVEPPTPAVALLHGRLRAAEAARLLASHKVALLHAEAAGYGHADVPPSVRETAVEAIAQVWRSQIDCDLPGNPEHLWGRWALIRASAPGSFKPVALQAFGAPAEAQLPFGVQAMVRTLTESGSFCDTLILGASPRDPVGAVHVTGDATLVRDDCLRFIPQWVSYGVGLESPSSEACRWPAYEVPLRFVDEDLMVIGDAQAADTCLQAWVRSS